MSLDNDESVIAELKKDIRQHMMEQYCSKNLHFVPQNICKLDEVNGNGIFCDVCGVKLVFEFEEDGTGEYWTEHQVVN